MAFDRHILNAFPPRYQPPTKMSKYSGEMNPRLWLEDYRLAWQADGVDSDSFIISNLPLFLANWARTWMEHLPPNRIQSWADLMEIFVETSRAPTFVLGTHGISKTTYKCLGKLFVSTSVLLPTVQRAA